MLRRELLLGCALIACGESDVFSRRPGNYFNPNAGGSGGIATPAAPAAPVAGYMQLIDAGDGGVSSSGAYPNVVDSYTPALGAYRDPYTQTGTSRPVHDLGGFNGFPCFRADAAHMALRSTTSSFAVDSVGGEDAPFIFYLSFQSVSQSVATAQALMSIGNSALSTDFLELIVAASTANLTVTKEDSRGAGGVLSVVGTSPANNRYTLRVECPGTQLRMELDGVEIAAFSSNNLNVNAITVDQDTLFALRRNAEQLYGAFRIQRRLWYRKSSETTAEQIQNYAYMHAGYTPVAGQCLLICEGDSTTAPDTLVSHPPWCARLGLSRTTVSNVATGSQRLDLHMIPQQFAEVICNYASGYAVDAASLVAGANDLALGGRTDDQLIADHGTWGTTSKSANPSRKLLCATMPPATSITGSAETYRLSFNTKLLAQYVSLGFDAVLRRDLIITNPATDTVDGKHATSAKDDEIAAAATAIFQGWGLL